MGAAKLRGAVIGYGFIAAEGHVPAYAQRADVEIVAVADICEARRRAARTALPKARIYENHEALLAAETAGPNFIDFVDIATPPSEHAAIARAAFARGLHVLCEKPLATTIEDAASMLHAAREARRVLFPCHNYKHAPVVREVRRIIEDGRVGAIRSVTLSTYRNSHAKGVPEWNTHWRRQRRYGGGGIAMDHGSHSFYLAFEWMGSYPTAVTAKLGCADPAKWDTEDSVSVVLSFPNGTAHTHLTWNAGIRKVIYTLQGERGGITIDDDRIEIALMESAESAGPTPGRWAVERYSVASRWMDASHVSWFDSLFDGFRSAIDAGELVGKDAWESYLCIQLITEAYRSAAMGCLERPLLTELPAAGGFGCLNL